MRNRRWLEKEPLAAKKIAPTADASRRLEKRLVATAIHAALAGVLAMTPFAQGSDLPDTSVFANAKEVSDDILGDTRGKFVTGARVVQFGIEMASKWESAGTALTAAANLHVGMSRGSSNPDVTFTPTFTVVDTSAPAAASSNTRVVQTGTGISNVAGVAQSIQVAGDAVAAVNNAGVEIDIISSSGPSGSSGPSLASAPSTPHHVTPSGAQLSATLGADAVGVAINVPGVGEIKQQIRSATGGGGGLVQSVTIAGDTVRVQNTMVLRVQMERPDGFNISSTQATLSNLRGIRPMGAF